jgi:predicted esterase
MGDLPAMPFARRLAALAAAVLLSQPFGDALAAPAPTPAAPPAPQQLDVPGFAPAYYFPPVGRARPRRVVVVLHGRGGSPRDDCVKWARVATSFGWLLCPSGQEEYENGGRTWANSWPVAQRVVDASMEALRAKHPRAVQRVGHVLVGFSEGAYAAQNIGIREPRVFDRWLILASATKYWGGEGLEAMQRNGKALKRVYLLTGALDGVVEESRDAYERLKKARVHVRLRVVGDMGHEVPSARMRELYLGPLSWLVNGR